MMGRRKKIEAERRAKWEANRLYRREQIERTIAERRAHSDTFRIIERESNGNDNTV
jgi:hypothetical protein